MRYLLFTFLNLSLLIGCGDTDLDNSLVISDPKIDTEAPVLSGSISHGTDALITQSSNAIWNEATDNIDVDHYLISVSVDDGNSTCNNVDFSSPTLNQIRVPASADFSGSGYQLINSALDGDSNTINVNLFGTINYCTSVNAVDAAGNISNPIFSSSTWNFNYTSCLEKITREPMSTDGPYLIDPDGAAGTDPAVNTFCDMTTDGGGWTLAIKYDSAQATAGAFALTAGSGRSLVSTGELNSINSTGSLTSSLSLIPFIQNGAIRLMHASKPNDAVENSTTYVDVYFSDIYQDVIDNPTQIFDSAFDTNNGDGVTGAVLSGTDATRKDQWYDSDNTTVLTAWDVGASAAAPFRIDGGEGQAMFTNGNREGAVYCSGASAGAAGHSNPLVQWGFYGQDGTQQAYGGTIEIGTFCSSALTGCVPPQPINMMFVR